MIGPTSRLGVPPPFPPRLAIFFSHVFPCSVNLAHELRGGLRVVPGE